MTDETDRLFRETFMSTALAARYDYHSRRRPGTRLERCERLWAQIKQQLKEHHGNAT